MDVALGKVYIEPILLTYILSTQNFTLKIIPTAESLELNT